MEYLVRLAGRSLRDLETIYEFIHAGSSEKAHAWFNSLTEAIYSLERFPGRGAAIPQDKKLRHLLFGAKPNTYSIIYAVDERKRAVTVLHIRHSARSPLPTQNTEEL